MIQKCSLALCAIALISFGYAETLAKAKIETQHCPENKKPVCNPYPSRFQIGGDYTYLHLVPDGSTNFNGHLGGAQALYEYRPMNDIYAAVRVTYKQGNTSTSPSSDERSIFYINTHQRLGYTFTSRKQKTTEVSLYTGIGYHYVGQELTVSGVSPLHFGYSAFYVPVGFALQYDATSIFSLGLNATWMPQVFSIASIDPLDGAFWTLTRTLANVHIEVPFGFMLDDAKRYAIFLTPFFEYWQDGHSFAVTTTGIPLDLPGNTYYFAGVDLNFSFRF